MQEIHFETTVKDGYIKIPDRYSRLNNKTVIVDIFSKETVIDEKKDRVKRVKEFLQQCSGILENTQIPPGITTKEIREMRLNEKYGQ